MGRSVATCSILRMGTGITGPLPRTTSNSMLHRKQAAKFDRNQVCAPGNAPGNAHPSAGSGVRMSLNMMTPSGRNARHGCDTEAGTVRVRNHTRRRSARACNDSSIAMSGVSERSRNGYLSENLRASQRAARPCVLSASALSKRRHVTPRLTHEPYGRPLSRCEARRQMAERSVARAGSAPSPRATRSRSGSPAVVCAACGARTLRRARVRGGRAARGASGASRTHAMRGGAGRPQRIDGARQAWAGRRRADTQ